MATSFAELETVKPVVKRRSRRMAYIAVVGLCLICGAITVAVLNKRAVVQAERQAVLFSGNQAASQRYADRPGPQITYAQSPYTPNTYTPNTYTPGTYTPYTSTPNAIAPGTYQTAPNSYTQNSALQSGPTGLTYGYSSNTPGVNQPMDPAELTITAEINRLRVQMRSASGEQKQKFRAELDESVSKLFDLRHAAQAKQVEKLEAELAEAKELHKKRGDRKKEIVERRIAELLEAADDLAWNRELSSGTNTAPSLQPSYLPSTTYNANSNLNYPYPYYAPPSSVPSYSIENPNPGPKPNPNSQPLSSTPPQLIPMNGNGLGANTLLPSSQSAAPFNAPPTNVPKVTKVEVDNEFIADVPKQEPTLKSSEVSGQSNELGSSALATDNFAQAIIYAGYELETAQQRALHVREQFSAGLASSDQLLEAKNNAAKTLAIWNRLKSRLKQIRQVALEEIGIRKDEIDVYEKLLSGGDNAIEPKLLESTRELARVNSGLRSLEESMTWAEEFESESLAPLKVQLDKLNSKPADPNATSEAATGTESKAPLNKD